MTLGFKRADPGRSSVRRGWSLAIFATALACALLTGPGVVAPASAQPLGGVLPADAIPKPGKNEQMLLEADQLLYDYNRNEVSAVGNVQIYYDGYALHAFRVTYERKTGRLIAVGQVRIVDPRGNVMTAENVDITDDFRDGFVNSLRMETVDKTYIAAANAERVEGQRTIIRKGVYTACEPCTDNPMKPPLWQIKAGKIIVDDKEHMITFQDARFEFLGVPIAWLPVFWTPDATVKRKSGILTPNLIFSDTLGFGARVPLYWAPAPDYDLTLTPAYYSRQGLLAEAEWRQRFANGEYSVDIAGINQQDGAAFIKKAGTPDASGLFSQKDVRGGVRTTGEFQLNPFWDFGWDFTLMSDRTFARDYHVLNPQAGIVASNAHLTGLNDRNFFDARGYYFTVTTDRKPNYPAPGDNLAYQQDRQATVHPVIDYSRYMDTPVLGGEVSMRSNVTSLSRGTSDTFDLLNGGILPQNGPGDGIVDHTRGPAGNFVRASAELDWQRELIGPAGVLLTPFAYFRGDAFSLDATDPNDHSLGLTTDNAVFRGMPAAGLEVRWPLMSVTPGASHVIQPVAQLIVRPDEQYAGQLPNEDAQSLVFDDTDLFRRDKFSGWDRVEGGTRLNVGVQYVGQFANGISIEGLIGQSYQLAGENSFAQHDLSGATAGLSEIINGTMTGLENERSDIVSRLSIDGASGFRLNVRGRVDSENFTLNRGEVEAAGPVGPVTASASLIYLRNLKSIDSGTDDSFVLRTAASANLWENWRAYGAVLFDVQNRQLVGQSFGLAYDDECLSISIAYNEVRPFYTDIAASKEVWLKVGLRTLGEVVTNSDWGSKSQ